MSEIKNKYSERIMKLLRQRINLEPDDTSRDEELNTYSAREAFTECCEWEGLIGYSYNLLSWVEYCYGIKLSELDFGFKHFCKQEAKWRLENSGIDFSDEDVEKLANILDKRSEEWVDGDVLCKITDEFLDNK